jgi:hypothetical protein
MLIVPEKQCTHPLAPLLRASNSFVPSYPSHPAATLKELHLLFCCAISSVPLVYLLSTLALQGTLAENLTTCAFSQDPPPPPPGREGNMVHTWTSLVLCSFAFFFLRAVRNFASFSHASLFRHKLLKLFSFVLSLV